MLTMRLIGVGDYSVFDDGQLIGRIRFASARARLKSCRSARRACLFTGLSS
jgi:hypothetical protein